MLLKDAKPEKVDAVHLRDVLMQRDGVNVSRKLFTTERGWVYGACGYGER